MPELPDIEAYLEALKARVLDQTVLKVRQKSPFLVRTISPPLNSIQGERVTELLRLGKRVVLGFGALDRFVVIHLMKAGRLKWGKPGAGLPGRMGLCAFDFEAGTLLLTEAGSKRRASIHVVDGTDGLSQLDPGGLELSAATHQEFIAVLRGHRHTLKRALTDPHLFSGIGSAYADEILLEARLSPMKRTDQVTEQEGARLWEACIRVIQTWRQRVIEETGSGWPKITAFRPGMGAHGKAGQPCPQCGSPIQKIVYAETETNYCAACQTEGRLLKDRALSRLLKDDWPRDLDAWEERRRGS